MIKAIIFDFDGTIGDTLPLITGSVRYAVNDYLDKPITDADVLDAFGPTEEGIILKFAPEHYEECCKKCLEYYADHHAELCPKPFDGVIDLIKFLKEKNLIVSLATGKGKKACDISLENYKMDNLFDKIETGSEEGNVKPQMINSILQYYNLKPEEVIYIGDMASDVDSARKAGVGIVSVLYGSNTEDEAVKAKQPDAICYTINELKNYLDSITN